MSFFSIFDANIRFIEKELEWRRYTTTKALLTKKKAKLVNCKEFAIVALDSKDKAFIIHKVLLKV